MSYDELSLRSNDVVSRCGVISLVRATGCTPSIAVPAFSVASDTGDRVLVASFLRLCAQMEQ